MVPKHQARIRSIVWNRIVPAWKSLLRSISFTPPSCWEEVFCLSWKWNPVLPVIGPGFAKIHAATVHRASMRFYYNVWVLGKFMMPAQAHQAYGLLAEEESVWLAVTAKVRQT